MHKIDKVVVRTDSGKRLSSVPSDVNRETENFFFQWMKSKAQPWLRKIHEGTDKPISQAELDEYFGKVKKGTAPGVSRIRIELWAWGAEEVKEELLYILNDCLDKGIVPGMWAKRLIRPLAKTETAIGLSDIRPIPLLDVTQKILTGILTERLSNAWNQSGVLHWAQMAFLQGRGVTRR